MTIFEMLQYDEGLRLDVYPDTEGYWTVGIGHLLTKDPSKSVAIAVLNKLVGRKTNGVITRAEAETIFKADVNVVIAGISKNQVIYPVYAGLDETRKMAIINMCFQMGVAGVASFTNSLKLIAAKKWEEAGVNLRASKWYKQTTNRATRVISVITTGTTKAYK